MTDWTIFRQNLETLIFAEGNPERVAARTGIPYFTIYNWRFRDQTPSLGSIRQLSTTYEIPVDDWLNRVLKIVDFKFSSTLSSSPVKPSE